MSMLCKCYVFGCANVTLTLCKYIYVHVLCYVSCSVLVVVFQCKRFKCFSVSVNVSVLVETFQRFSVSVWVLMF